MNSSTIRCADGVQYSLMLMSATQSNKVSGCKGYNININANKTHDMAITRSQDVRLRVQMEEQWLNRVDRFKHLGL